MERLDLDIYIYKLLNIVSNYQHYQNCHNLTRNCNPGNFVRAAFDGQMVGKVIGNQIAEDDINFKNRRLVGSDSSKPKSVVGNFFTKKYIFVTLFKVAIFCFL